MGKATRWLKGLLGIKKADQNPNPNLPPTNNRPDLPPKPSPSNLKEKRRWSFVKSSKDKSYSSRQNAELSHQFRRYGRGTTSPSPSAADSVAVASSYACAGDDPNKHAIAVAAASAAAAEAAVVAAQAAAAVVRLTSIGRSNVRLGGGREAWAALVIQSHFRGYLARRALRALKGLVKLQAFVRGHIMRKKAAETMRCMQAMLRAQVRARAVRAHLLDSPHSSGKLSQINHPGPPTPEKFEQSFQTKNANCDRSPIFKRNSSISSCRGQDRGYFSSSWSDPQMNDPTWEPPRGDKILEIDPGKPNLAPPNRRTLLESSSHSLVGSDQISHAHSCTASKDSTAHQAAIRPTSIEVQLPHLNPLKFSSHHFNEESDFCTAENSSQYYSASSRGGASSRRGAGPFTPTKSDGSFNGLSGYLDCPSYMACTESSRAKVRSLSAPRQRPNYERTSSAKRWSAHHNGFGDSRSSSQRAFSLHSSFTSKAYTGSGRLDRLGMPVKNDTLVYYSGYLN